MPNSAENKPLIPVLTGPTGSGKTGIALKILESYPDVHIISADSRQIYKHLSIGTDKPSLEILQKYTFHLTDFVEPGERYTAYDFVDDTEKILDELIIQKKGPLIPMICGGTGLYIKSLVEGIVEIPEDDMNIRQQLEDDAVKKGPQYLYEKLQKIDSFEAQKTHPHNIKRIIRALEIYHITGRSKSDIIAQAAAKEKGYSFKMVCFLPDRDTLYERINNRVDLMIKSGLLDEAENLYKIGLRERIKAVNVIGYNELFRYFDGELLLDSAVNLIKQNTRRFAKRQITWFRGMKDLKTINNSVEIIDSLLKFWSNKKNNCLTKRSAI